MFLKLSIISLYILYTTVLIMCVKSFNFVRKIGNPKYDNRDDNCALINWAKHKFLSIMLIIENISYVRKVSTELNCTIIYWFLSSVKNSLVFNL